MIEENKVRHSILLLAVIWIQFGPVVCDLGNAHAYQMCYSAVDA